MKARVELWTPALRRTRGNTASFQNEPRKYIQDSIEDAMRHLGVEVIWYEEHCEVAGHLRSLSRSPKNDGPE
jgi:hypothetical protein